MRTPSAVRRRLCVAAQAAGSAGVIWVALVAVVPAAARSAPPPDVAVAGCPAGAASAALQVRSDAAGTWRMGPFVVRLSADRLRVDADGRTLWSSARGGFVAAGAGDPGIVDGGGGFYRVRASVAHCWRPQAVTAPPRPGSELRGRGRPSGRRRAPVGSTGTPPPLPPPRAGPPG